VIRPIQYLRALAAMMVVWAHALYISSSIAQRLGAPYFGGSGVDLFFVISGFIMVVTTTRREVTPQKFFLLRIIRVVPLYWLATLAWVACTALAESDVYRSSATAIAKSLLFVPYISPGTHGGPWPVLQNGWTLNYEMFFYALFALSLAAPRRLRVAGLAVTLGSLVVIGKLFGPFANPLAAFYTSPWLLEFVAGMVLAAGWLQSGARDSWSQSLFLIVLGFYCIGALHSRLIILGGAFLVVAGCLNPRICAIHSRLLLELGNASYSIYLVHQFVLEGLARVWSRLFSFTTWATSVLFMTLALVLCVLAGSLCYRFIERPLTSRLRGLVKRSDAVAQDGPPPLTQTAQGHTAPATGADRSQVGGT
jgi:exopolysaccharide production protein ExoZ